MIHKKLIENIKTHRKRKGITQTKLAEEMGVTVQTYANWEHGRANPGITKIIWMADYFGTQVHALLGINNWKEKKHILPTHEEPDTKLRLWVYLKYEEGFKDCEVVYTGGRFYKDGIDVTEDVTQWQFIPAKPIK